MFRGSISQSPLLESKMGILTRTKKQEKLPSTRQNAVLKVVDPRGYVEVFCKAISAGEIMNRHPRHCIARPDFFVFPWIVVHPESLLVPGKVFYLVPYHTMDKILKAKQQELESMNLSLQQNQSAEKHQNHKGVESLTRFAGRQYYHHDSNNFDNCKESSCGDTQGQDSDDGSSPHRESFYKTWNRMRRIIHLSHEESLDQLNLGLDLPLDSGRSNLATLGRYISCLRKADCARKKLNLKVSFASPLVIPPRS